MTAYRRALAADPAAVVQIAALGKALRHAGNPADAALWAKRCWFLQPDEAAHGVDLAIVLFDLGQTGRSASVIRCVLTQVPALIGPWNNLGNVFLCEGKTASALKIFLRLSRAFPGVPEIAFNTANLLKDLGQTTAAAGLFKTALVFRPDFPQAYHTLCRKMLDCGNARSAFTFIRRGLLLEPSPKAKALSALTMTVVADSVATRDIRPWLMAALNEPWIRPADLFPACITVLKRDGVLLADQTCQLTGDPLLLAVLQNTPVADRELEHRLIGMRASLLNRVAGGEVLGEGELEFCCALAQQCFINEYVFAIGEDENCRLAKLRARLTEPASTVTPAMLALFACYQPLNSLPDDNMLLSLSWPAPVAALLTQQISEPQEERRLMAGIPLLTPIDDDISRRVRAQYEESPYPRWTRTTCAEPPVHPEIGLRLLFPQGPHAPMPRKPVFEILIAGCGTGRHAIETALRFRDAKVTAVDLSCRSLAYAIRKSREMGVTNIDYAQADILRLDHLGRHFDQIESVGVLHHLGDPSAGWRLLLSLLRPGGVMRVGLYSEVARRGVMAARQFIQERGFGTSVEEIRQCRQEFFDREDEESLANITRSPDFFSISNCRDLLFHTEEHRTTIPQLAAFIETNNLAFIGFEIDSSVTEKYRNLFPDDKTLTDLASWDKFESMFPNTFGATYQFWVQKKNE
ncbi:MAG TPA: methyltransferase domain-containing protein [Rhodospirillaceae bacterium]|nr:methyltransferase domain-containing protein [Rhodospirillaceae bacterium]